MKTIRIVEEDGCMRVFNPMYVKDVRLVSPGENGLDWAVVLNFDDGGTVARPFKSKDKAEVFFRYVDECLKSIGNL